MNEQKLVISYSNEAPVELNTLANSLKAVGSRYKKHLKKEGINSSEDTNLYIREIKKGSIVVELIQAAAPVLSDASSVITFFMSLKAIIEYFSSPSKPAKKPEEIENFKKSDYQEVSHIVGPAIVAGGNINIFVGGGQNDDRISIEGNTARFIEKTAMKAIENLNDPDVFEREKSLMSFTQASNTKTGFRGRDNIDDTTSKPVKFEPADLAKEVSDIDGNVFRSIFSVDLKVIMKNDQVKEYVITKVHGNKTFED